MRSRIRVATDRPVITGPCSSRSLIVIVEFIVLVKFTVDLVYIEGSIGMRP